MNTYFEKVKQMKIQYRIIIVSTFIWGILAYGYMFFNKLSFFDDVVALKGVGATYSSGRWFLGILEIIVSKLFKGCYSVPLLIGVLTLVLIAVTNVLLCSIFEIENELSCVIAGGLLVVFPAMTALYSFMFTSGYYVFSIMLAVLAVYVVKKSKNIFTGSLLSICFIALSMGIYQSNVGFTILCFFFLFILQAMDIAQVQVKELIKTAFKYVVCLIGGLGAYLLINKIFLFIMSVDLNSYRGISSMYSTEVFNLDFRFLLETFFNHYDDLFYFGVYVENTGVVYEIILAIVGMIIIYNFVYLIRIKKWGCEKKE